MQKIVRGWVTKVGNQYEVEADFWGTSYTTDINQASFNPEDFCNGICGTYRNAVKAIKVYDTNETHEKLLIRVGHLKGKNAGKTEVWCPRCNMGRKNKNPEVGVAYIKSHPCTIVTTKEYEW